MRARADRGCGSDLVFAESPLRQAVPDIVACRRPPMTRACVNGSRLPRVLDGIGERGMAWVLILSAIATVAALYVAVGRGRRLAATAPRAVRRTKKKRTAPGRGRRG